MKRLDYLYQGEKLKDLGRYFVNEEKKAKMFTFSASGFEVYFLGTYLKSEIIATECGKKQGEAAISVVIDEQTFLQGKKIVLDEPDKVYSLASDLPYGLHRLRMYKRTESSCSLTGWKYIETDGDFKKVEDDYKLKIEIYGDSITAGNGDEGVEGDEEFETRTENALTSYGALAAEKLKADFSIIAIGGYPVYKSPWNAFATVKTIPQMFSFADYDWGTTFDNSRSWDHKKFIPDLVVINLGTNDDQYLLPLKEGRDLELVNFKKAMKDFVDLILRTYPQSKVLLTIGMIKVTLVTKLIKEIALSYPSRVFFHEFISLKEGGYMANGGHPNQKMHIEAGEELYQVLKKIKD
ncbi:MAG: GDSL-type esterase/lipase family protein [Bacilli bacterium]|jgi:lysophospholipase L1-like esterase|nr:GDSL-type esterase/lipase family protein [Bacilli bacterium]